jgi:hypothetical protein
VALPSSWAEPLDRGADRHRSEVALPAVAYADRAGFGVAGADPVYGIIERRLTVSIAMKTFEFPERAGEDRLVRLRIPVESAHTPYHVVVHVEPTIYEEPGEYLSDEFVNETAGKWVGELKRTPQGEFERRQTP